jgi:hypothetical protein
LRHYARAQAFAHLTDKRNTGCNLSQAFELFFEVGARLDAQVTPKIAVTLLDLIHDRLPFAAERERKELFEPIGNSGKGRMHDYRPQAFG